MKRFFILVACAMLFLLPSQALSVGTCTVTYPDIHSISTQKILVSCTADASAATVPNATIIPKRGWITQVETNPGSTAPTTLYDIVINNANDVDVMGGALANRSATASEVAVPLAGGNAAYVYVEGTALTMVTTNNAVNSATFTVTIYILIDP